MGKIGIVTNYGNYNFGTSLQNYAVEHVLKSLGFDVETIIKSTNKHGNIGELKNKISKFKDMSFKIKCFEIYKKIVKKTYELEYKEELEKRKNAFNTFSNQFLNQRNYRINKELGKKFDYFIVGSDCIWGPSENTFFAFLEFAPKNKKIAFAPSFACSTIPKEYKEKYREGLSGFAHLSIREQAGVNIIKELIGRNAELLVDPTMLLSREHWVSISKKSVNKPREKYLLNYMLGKTPYKWKKQINKIADRYNLKIVKIAEIKERKRFGAGPQEIIDYLKSAEIVVTDSFHATIFSILFSKPFIVYDRQMDFYSCFSRLETLLNKFKFEKRFVDNMDECNVFNINFSHTKAILEKERKKSYNYLKKSLGVKNFGSK